MLLAGLVSGVTSAATVPALASPEAFMTEIANKKWECSYTSYPQVRFIGDKIEALAADAILSTTTGAKVVEPGILRQDFRDGSFGVFIFSDDLQSFVMGLMTEMDEFTAETPDGLPAEGGSPLGVTFTKHPFWNKSRLHADKMELLDSMGKVFATNECYSFLPQVRGVVLPEKQAGMIVMSRQSPGKGWFLSGKFLGTGVRTDRAGFFKPPLQSKLTQFPLRSAQFSYALLNAGFEQLAEGQERYGLINAANYYGETSEQVGEAWSHAGTLRGWSRSYAKAPEYHRKALEHVRQHFSSDRQKTLDYSINLASSLNDAGDFAGAKKALADAYPLLAKDGGNFRGTFLFHEELGTAEFGLRSYPQAAKAFLENIQRAQTARMTGNVVESLLQLIPCQMMQNQAAQAEASLKQLMQVQDERTKSSPSYDFDTWKIAFACVALGKNEDAVKYAPVRQRQNWVAYEEYGRMVSLFNSGDKAGAQALAREFVGRFSNVGDIRVRNDIDPITVKLTQAIAEQTPAAIGALEQLWASQVENLRSRPLKNYAFAKVMVATIAKLKAGR